MRPPASTLPRAASSRRRFGSWDPLLQKKCPRQRGSMALPRSLFICPLPGSFCLFGGVLGGYGLGVRGGHVVEPRRRAGRARSAIETAAATRITKVGIIRTRNCRCSVLVMARSS